MNIVNAKYCLFDYILGCFKPLSRKCVLQFASQQPLTRTRRLEVPAAVVAVTAAAVVAVLVIWIDVELRLCCVSIPV